MGSGKKLKRAINKYGIENFDKEILFVFDAETDMNNKESELVTEEFCLREDTYNICPGGKGGWGYVNKNGLNKSENQKLAARKIMSKMRASQCNEMATKNLNLHRENGIKALKKKYPNGTFFGRTHTDNTKEKMSLSLSGKSTGTKNSQYGTMWITDGKINKKIKKDSIMPDGWFKGRIC